MLAKRIIPCLDVKEGKVVKGVRFENHQCVGEIEALAAYYNDSGADELVFYDITASTENCCVDTHWIQRVAKLISIPFCVAGGIKTPQQAEQILAAGADKISINSPALNNPNLITTLAEHFGQQCVVVGIDSFYENNDYLVYQYTGDINTCQRSVWRTEDWVKEVENRGAGEIVLNCMNQDGVQKGYDIDQYRKMAPLTRLPLIASGGAGQLKHFLDLFNNINVEGALAASVFHNGVLSISQVKQYCQQHGVEMRA